MEPPPSFTIDLGSKYDVEARFIFGRTIDADHVLTGMSVLLCFRAVFDNAPHYDLFARKEPFTAADAASNTLPSAEIVGFATITPEAPS